MKSERYISVDIESSGPIPGKYSMLSLGACAVDDMSKRFYVEIQPINKEFVPAALKVSGFDLSELERSGQTPKNAMQDFGKWVSATVGDSKAVFVGFNGCYDWQFVNWYFETFTEKNPFGFGGVDIKSFYCNRSRAIQKWPFVRHGL